MCLLSKIRRWIKNVKCTDATAIDVEAAHCLEITRRHEVMYKAADQNEAAEAAHYIGNSIHARIGSLERARKKMNSA